MVFNEKDIKKGIIVILLSFIAILAFLTVRPLIYSIIGGLILAYILYPVYKRITSFVGNKTLSAFIMLFIVILVVVVPIWFISPLLIQQVFELFRNSQNIDVNQFINTIFPTASPQFTSQIAVTLGSIISKATTSIISSLINLFLDLPSIAVNLFIAGFVFFYALRDSEGLVRFASELSPIHKDKQKVIIDQFKGITDSVVYGLFIVGIIQGILTGLGLLIFGIPNALVLTVLATFLSLFPLLGPYIVWIPVSIFLFASGNVGIAIGYLIYNMTVVSTLDNVLRSYIVSRRSNISPAIVITGMIGGVLVFGTMGLLLGPLILAYFITFLKSYKEKNLYSLFSE